MSGSAAARKVGLGALVGLVMLLAALFVTSPKASAALSDCPSGYMCVWQANNYTGALSYWAASDTGCHNHLGNPDLRSFYNNTSNKTLSLPGWGISFAPGYGGTGVSSPYTGALCW
jgi:hypothetical protein